MTLVNLISFLIILSITSTHEISAVSAQQNAEFDGGKALEKLTHLFEFARKDQLKSMQMATDLEHKADQLVQQARQMIKSARKYHIQAIADEEMDRNLEQLLEELADTEKRKALLQKELNEVFKLTKLIKMEKENANASKMTKKVFEIEENRVQPPESAGVKKYSDKTAMKPIKRAYNDDEEEEEEQPDEIDEILKRALVKRALMERRENEEEDDTEEDGNDTEDTLRNLLMNEPSFGEVNDEFPNDNSDRGEEEDDNIDGYF